MRGSIKVSQAGSGGRLEVGLFAAGVSLAKAGHSEQVPSELRGRAARSRRTTVGRPPRPPHQRSVA